MVRWKSGVLGLEVVESGESVGMGVTIIFEMKRSIRVFW